jgi:murein DD-endopeptidase MepM/ murein hydrolase activator NlpD
MCAGCVLAGVAAVSAWASPSQGLAAPAAPAAPAEPAWQASASSALAAGHDSGGGETALRLTPERSAAARADRDLSRAPLDSVPAAAQTFSAAGVRSLAASGTPAPTLADAAAALLARQQAAQRAAAAAAKARAAAAAAKAAAARLAQLHRWVRPNAGPLSSPFGMRWGRMHEGVDLAGGYGSPIRAAVAGTVLYAGSESGYGEVLKVLDWDGTQTWYGHMSKFMVKVGDQVTPGEEVALVGAAGDATGPHLHFEVRIGGTPVDPIPFLAARGVHI